MVEPTSYFGGATLRDVLTLPAASYHPIDGITFKRYAPVMPMALPAYGYPHPAKTVDKTSGFTDQNLFRLYGNPRGAYALNLAGQR